MKNLIKNFFFILTIVIVGMLSFASCEDDGLMDDVLLDSTQVDRYNDITGDSITSDDSVTVGNVLDSLSDQGLLSDTGRLLGTWYLEHIIRDTVMLQSNNTIIKVGESDTVPTFSDAISIFGDYSISNYQDVEGNTLPNMLIEQYSYYVEDTVISSDTLLMAVFRCITYKSDVEGNYALGDDMLGWFNYDMDDNILDEYFNQNDSIQYDNGQSYNISVQDNVLIKKYLIPIDNTYHYQYSKIFIRGFFSK